MKAILIHEFGGREKLTLGEVRPPVPGAHDVLVRVKACAMNHLDIWVRQGLLKLPMPHILGSDISGIIEEVGAEVTDLNVGDSVLVSPGLSCGHCEKCLQGDDNFCADYKIFGENVWGGYGEAVKVPRQNVLPLPENLSFEEAASIPLTFLTTWQMLVRKAKIQSGQTVLVLAAGSGIGVAAIQIAKLFGATVFAAASTDEKLKKAKSLGADFLINYTTDDFEKEIKKMTHKKGVDVVVEQVGEATWEKSILSATWGGTIVTCGATSGFLGKTDLRHLFFRQLKLLGSTMGSKGDLFEILRWVTQGKLRPVVDEVIPLKDAARGHEKMESRAQFGKIVLVP